MTFKATRTQLKEILSLRSLFLQENNFQIRYNACHERGWTDSYLLTYDEKKIGYGSVKGNENLGDRDTVFEFYVVPSFRNKASLVFLELVRCSKATFIECQTNEGLLTSLLYQFGKDSKANAVLFADSAVSALDIDKAVFRKRKDTDVVFEKLEPAGEYILEYDSEVVASGGFLLHYNIPFADLYMEVREDYRRKGFGSFLLQELKRECYLAGRVPAARCNINNAASKASLLKAGFKIAGFMVIAEIKA
jgi:GNAT superfamily N-acetyltransferase